MPNVRRRKLGVVETWTKEEQGPWNLDRKERKDGSSLKTRRWEGQQRNGTVTRQRGC